MKRVYMYTIKKIILIYCATFFMPGSLLSANVLNTDQQVFSLFADYFIHSEDSRLTLHDIDLQKWNSNKIKPNVSVEEYIHYSGDGWFRYDIEIPQDLSLEQYAISIPYSFGSSWLYFNGELIYRTHSPEELSTGAERRPGAPAFITIPGKLIQAGKNIFVVQSKGVDGMGGQRYPIRFGSEAEVKSDYMYGIIKTTGITAILVFLGLFFGAYYFTQKQSYYIYFAATSIGLGFWNFGYEGMALYFIDAYWPEIFITFSSAIPITAFFLMFFYKFFEIKPNIYEKLFINMFYLLLPILWIEFFLTGGISFFTHKIYLLYIIMVFLGVFYLVYLSIKAIRLKKEMAWRLLAGLSLVFLAITAFMLTDMGFLPGNPNYITESFLAMIIVFASVLRTKYSAIYNELEKAYTNLKELDKTKDDFLANTSHELRTPLQAIMSLVENILKSSQQMSVKSVEQLNLVKFSAGRLSYLVDDILDFSKIQEDDIRFHIEDHSLKEQAAKVIALTDHLTKSKNLQVINHIEEHIYIKADKERVQQILFNIIGNAIKFTQKGKVEISAKTDAGNVEVVISDTGIGIDENKMEQIFDPFQVVSDTETKRDQGAGLGLAISRELLEKQNGSIEIQSKKGEGTKVAFKLPLGIPSHDLAKQISVDDVKSIQVETPVNITNINRTSNGEYVLIVDDDPIIISVLVDILESQKMNVLFANNGKAALEIIYSSGKPSLAILDVMMPDISGIELCEKIRKQYSVQDLPILMFTAKTRFKDLTRAINSGATDFLTKPVDYDEFILRVKNLLNIAHAEKEKRKLLKEQRQEIFYDLHDHLGGFLTDTQLTVKALSMNSKSDNHILDELKETIDKTILTFRERLNYIEDLTVISKNFLSGLQQILLRRYLKIGRTLKFQASDKLFEKIMDKRYSNIRNEFFSIATEITTNDLKYGKDMANWKFLDKKNSLYLTIKTKSTYNLVKNGTGYGTSTLMQKIAALNGDLQLNFDQGVLIINISIPWNQSEKIIHHAS